MNRCVKCRSNKLREGLQELTLAVGPRVFEGKVRGWSCKQCGEIYYDGPSIGRFERDVAMWLTRYGFSDGAELRLVRKVAGLRATDLAELLGVSSETVSHWETGKHPSDVATREVIAELVLDALGGRTGTRDRLRALAQPAPLARVRLSPKGKPRAAV
jgi:YgiT-type zinc finger domain-containing protein